MIACPPHRYAAAKSLEQQGWEILTPPIYPDDATGPMAALLNYHPRAWIYPDPIVVRLDRWVVELTDSKGRPC